MKVSVSKSAPFLLLVTSYGRTSTAGPRVLRGGIHPDVRWSHETADAANTDAQKLQDYFDELNRTSRPSKRAIRAFGS